MAIVIQPFTRECEPAVAAFNQRLAPQKTPVAFHFPERCVSEWLPPRAGCRIRQDYFLAIDDSAAVRGGYILKTQDFWINGGLEPIGNLQLPLSEGIVDPRYGFVGLQLVLDAVKRQPLLYSLGMGGLDGPYPKLLKGLRWSLFPVPFLFRVVKPAGVFCPRAALAADRPALRRLGASLLAATGTAWLGTRIAQRVNKPAIRADARPEVEGARSAGRRPGR